jgi:predicted helicase
MWEYLKSDLLYVRQFREVWFWLAFPSHADFGNEGIGIDIVVCAHDGDSWAVQRECYKPDTCIDKSLGDIFLSVLDRSFCGIDDPEKKIRLCEG